MQNSKKLTTLLESSPKQLYEKIELLSLDEKETLFYIENGNADLFYIEHIKNKPEGPRHFINSFSKGELIFNLSNPSSNTAIGNYYLIVYQNTSLLKPLEAKIKLHLQETPSDIPLFSQLINNWLIKLETPFINYSKEENHTIDQIWDYQGPYTLLKDEKAFFFFQKEKFETIWIQPEKGSYSLLNSIKITTHTPFFAIPPQLSIEGLEELSLIKKTTTELIENKLIWEALRSTHKLLTTGSEILLKEQIKSNKDQLKKEKEIRSLTKTYDSEQLINILNKKKTYPFTPNTSPLLQVCQKLGAFNEFTISPPPHLNSTLPLSTQLNEICTHSHIRYRKVNIFPDFHLKDRGPLIGFYGENQTPVALFNQKATHYLIYNPETQITEKVTSEISKKLHHKGFSLYPPLDEVPNKKNILKFTTSKLSPSICLIIFIGIITALLNLYTPMSFSWVIDKAIPDRSFILLNQIVLGIIAVSIGVAIFNYCKSITLIRLEGILSNKLQGALWDRMLRLPLFFFKKYDTGDLYQRVMAIDHIRELIGSAAINAILSGLFSTFYLIIMVYYSLKLTLFVLIPTILMLFIFALGSFINVSYEQQIITLYGKINGFLVQLLQGISKIRNANAEQRVYSKWISFFSEKKVLELSVQKIHIYINIIKEVITKLSIIVIYFIIITSYEETTKLGKPPFITIGGYIAFHTAYGAFSTGLYSMAASILNVLVKIIPLWKRADPILKETIEVDHTKIAPPELKGYIKVENLYFRFQKDKPYILNNISFKINQGESVAFIGPSGCGKSTLINLLLGTIIPEKGHVFYDQKDINNLNLLMLRQQIGTVLQNGAILSGSLRDNITVGRVASEEKIWHAIKAASFEENLNKMPMGLETFLQSGGDTLSGGEKQRLLIARALLNSPKILIFDEATSALDNKTQKEIKNNIDNLKVTRIIIAHRLSTIRNVDRIYVIDNNTIAESGTYDQLALHGKFFPHYIDNAQENTYAS